MREVMSDALKQIEERHAPAIKRAKTFVRLSTVPPYVMDCIQMGANYLELHEDVVKLARALDEAIRDLVSAGFCEPGKKCEHGLTHWVGDHCGRGMYTLTNMKRVLREVAGDKP